MWMSASHDVPTQAECSRYKCGSQYLVNAWSWTVYIVKDRLCKGVKRQNIHGYIKSGPLLSSHTHTHTRIQDVRWLHANTSRSYSWGHCNSEMSHDVWIWSSMVTELRIFQDDLNSDETRLQMYFQRDGAPHISVDTWRSSWMSRSLTDGLITVIRRIGHHSHRTSLLNFHVCGTWKTWCLNAK
jgi:hypothetical protein